MIKIYVLIVIILACGWGYDHWGKVTLENDLNHLKKDYLNLESDFEQTMQQKMFWEKEFEKRNQEKILLSKRNAELEKEATKDKAYFNWNADISNTSVIKRLQAN